MFVCLFVYGLEAPVPVLGLRGEVRTPCILPITSTLSARVGKVSRSLCKTSGLVILPRESEFQPAANARDQTVIIQTGGGATRMVHDPPLPNSRQALALSRRLGATTCDGHA